MGANENHQRFIKPFSASIAIHSLAFAVLAFSSGLLWRGIRGVGGDAEVRIAICDEPHAITFPDYVEPERVSAQLEPHEPQLTEADVVELIPTLAPLFEPAPLPYSDPFAALPLDLSFKPPVREPSVEEPDADLLATEHVPITEPACEPESPSTALAEELSPVYRRAPRYPLNALRMRWEGSLLCQIEVNADGTVAGVTVSESSGYGILDAAAIRALLLWRFDPEPEPRSANKRVLPYRISFKLPKGLRTRQVCFQAPDERLQHLDLAPD